MKANANPHVNDDILSHIMTKGFERIINNISGGHRNADKEKALSAINFMVSSEKGISNLSELDADNFLRFFTCCQRLDIDVENSDQIQTVVAEKIKKLSYLANERISYNNRNEFALAGKLSNFINEDSSFAWKPIATTLIDSVGSGSYYWSYHTEAIADFLSKWATEDYQDYTNKFIKTIKKNPHEFRRLVFCGSIRSGNLEKKTARKIRSDASENASLYATRELFEHKDKYSNFYELALQLSDSKHYSVRSELAENLPVHQLSCLLGTDCQSTKHIVQRRIDEYEREKEEKIAALASLAEESSNELEPIIQLIS